MQTSLYIKSKLSQLRHTEIVQLSKQKTDQTRKGGNYQLKAICPLLIFEFVLIYCNPLFTS